MRLIYVTAMMPYGPMEAFIIPEVSELRKRGHDVLVVPMWPRGPVVHADARTFVDEAVREAVWSSRILGSAAAEWAHKPLKATGSVARLLKSRTPRILAMNAAVAPKALWLAKVARRWQAEHIHAHWLTAPATMALIASEVSGVPWSATAHRYDIYERNLIREKTDSASFVRVISERGAQDLAAMCGAGRSKLRVIHMGVPLPEETAPLKPLGPQGLRVLVAANLREVKGHRFLLSAAHALKLRGHKLHVDLAGDGPLRQELAQLCDSLGLGDSVRLLGVVPHRELLEGMRKGRWDVAVLPSIAVTSTEQEGIPVFLMEAMAYGLPVVSTRTGCIPELLEDGAGLLVADKSAPQLAVALEQLMNDDARSRLASLGRSRIEKRFAIGAVVDSLVGEFQGSGAASVGGRTHAG